LKESEIEFEVLREPWNKYSVDDGSYIKTRFIVTKFRKREPTTSEEKMQYGFEGQNLMVAYNVPQELKGPPSTKTFSPDELRQKSTDMRYSTVYEDWNEYVLEDGTAVRIKNTVVEIIRSDKTDRSGDPVYVVNTSQLLGFKPRARGPTT
jgi:hypothetical protein